MPTDGQPPPERAGAARDRAGGAAARREERLRGRSVQASTVNDPEELPRLHASPDGEQATVLEPGGAEADVRSILQSGELDVSPELPTRHGLAPTDFDDDDDDDDEHDETSLQPGLGATMRRIAEASGLLPLSPTPPAPRRLRSSEDPERPTAELGGIAEEPALDERTSLEPTLGEAVRRMTSGEPVGPPTDEDTEAQLPSSSDDPMDRTSFEPGLAAKIRALSRAQEALGFETAPRDESRTDLQSDTGGPAGSWDRPDSGPDGRPTPLEATSGVADETLLERPDADGPSLLERLREASAMEGRGRRLTWPRTSESGLWDDPTALEGGDEPTPGGPVGNDTMLDFRSPIVGDPSTRVTTGPNPFGRLELDTEGERESDDFRPVGDQDATVSVAFDRGGLQSVIDVEAAFPTLEMGAVSRSDSLRRADPSAGETAVDAQDPRGRTTPDVTIERGPSAVPRLPTPVSERRASMSPRIERPSALPPPPGFERPPSPARPGRIQTHVIEQLEDGERFGPYVLLRQVGVGGMAEVRLACQTGAREFLKPCVVKRIVPELAYEPDVREMFAEEGRICAVLHHPNIVRLYEYDEVDGVPFLALELVDGTNLAMLDGLTGDEGLPPKAIAEIGRRVAAALSYAHGLTSPAGVPLRLIHRDISPQNVLVSRAGEVKLADFGIARFDGRAHRTALGPPKGKLRYLSPEQLRYQPIDHRVDLFALGVVLTELVSRRLLMPDGALTVEDIEGLVRQRCAQARQRLPGAFVDLLVRLTADDPDRRPRDAAEVEAALADLVSSLAGEELPELAARVIEPQIPSAEQAIYALASSASSVSAVDPDLERTAHEPPSGLERLRLESRIASLPGEQDDGFPTTAHFVLGPRGSRPDLASGRNAALDTQAPTLPPGSVPGLLEPQAAEPTIPDDGRLRFDSALGPRALSGPPTAPPDEGLDFVDRTPPQPYLAPRPSDGVAAGPGARGPDGVRPFAVGRPAAPADPVEVETTRQVPIPDLGPRAPARAGGLRGWQFGLLMALALVLGIGVAYAIQLVLRS